MDAWEDEQREADAVEASRRKSAVPQEEAIHAFYFDTIRLPRADPAPSPPTTCRVDYMREIARLDALGECSKALRGRASARFGELPRQSPLFIAPDCPCAACTERWAKIKAFAADFSAKHG